MDEKFWDLVIKHDIFNMSDEAIKEDREFYIKALKIALEELENEELDTESEE